MKTPVLPPLGTKDFGDSFSLLMASIVSDIREQNSEKDLGASLAVATVCKTDEKACVFLSGTPDTLVHVCSAIVERLLDLVSKQPANQGKTSHELLAQILSQIATGAMNFQITETAFDHTKKI